MASLSQLATAKQEGKRESAQAQARGANAAVIGILGAALYDPVSTSATVKG
jgi:hypothetical protein